MAERPSVLKSKKMYVYVGTSLEVLFLLLLVNFLGGWSGGEGRWLEWVK